MTMLERFCLEIAGEAGQSFDLGAAIAVFQRWIRVHRDEGLLIDVADYRHVPEGPGVVLIGHEADYFLAEADGRVSLRYNCKRPGPETNAERLRAATRRALEACRRLEAEPEFAPSHLRFDAGSLRLILNDRLRAPNDPATLEALALDLDAFARWLHPGQDPRIVRDTSDPRERFTVEIASGVPSGVAPVLERLGATS